MAAFGSRWRHSADNGRSHTRLKKIGRGPAESVDTRRLANKERSREASEEAIEDFQQEYAPLLQVEPLIDTDEQGRQTGYAYTYRGVELLRLRQEGYNTDKCILVLGRLQEIFSRHNLPLLLPVSCTEGVHNLSYVFTGNQTALTQYFSRLEAMPLDENTAAAANQLWERRIRRRFRGRI